MKSIAIDYHKTIAPFFLSRQSSQFLPNVAHDKTCMVLDLDE